MSIIDKITENRENFIKFNDIKYQRFQELIAKEGIDRIINSIPVLLSLNNRKLPGYVEGPVPTGISNYEPSKDLLRFLQGKFHLSRLTADTQNPFIEMFAVMGSVGTIAYNKKSDFDCWICVDCRKISSEMFLNFRRKTDAIQKWAMGEINREVHLFINDIESVRNNIFAEDEEEAFGTTTGAVLKDEFFRSSIIIAGKIPFWWVIPSFVMDSEYQALLKRVPDDFFSGHFVDLGNLYEISKEDFLGSALFQIIKSLGNPFKSIMKIGVLEKYLFGREDSPLLSQKVKTNIIRGNFTNSILDSYILMFEEVYSYYESIIHDPDLLKILRQNLYLKIDPQLSKYAGMKDRASLPYKVIVMFKYIREWKWNLGEIKDLDDFTSWDYNKIMTFWNQVKKFMLMSYQKISNELSSTRLSEKISENDFKLLSRKIKTHFSRENEKIDYYVTFKETPYEPILYIEPVNQGIEEAEWRLYKRKTSEDDRSIITIKTETRLEKLLAWASINQIYNPVFSRINVQSGYKRVHPKHVIDLLTRISAMFNDRELSLKNDYFIRETFNQANVIIINFNQENAETVTSILHIYRTSWGESYIREHASPEDLMKVLYTVLKDGIVTGRAYEKYCDVVTPEPYTKIYKGIETMFRDSYSFITGAGEKLPAGLTIQHSGLYAHFRRNRDTLTVKAYRKLTSLLAHVSLNPSFSMNHEFIGDDPAMAVLREMKALVIKNSITITYEENGRSVMFYLINEKGNLFTYTGPVQYKEEVLITLYKFSTGAIKRVNSASLIPVREQIGVHKISRDRLGNISFSDMSTKARELYLVKSARISS